MTTIGCPRCGNRISHYSIDIVANGGKVVGMRGIVCPVCSEIIRNSDISRLVIIEKFDNQKDPVLHIYENSRNRYYSRRKDAKNISEILLDKEQKNADIVLLFFTIFAILFSIIFIYYDIIIPITIIIAGVLLMIGLIFILLKMTNREEVKKIIASIMLVNSILLFCLSILSFIELFLGIISLIEAIICLIIGMSLVSWKLRILFPKENNNKREKIKNLDNKLCNRCGEINTVKDYYCKSCGNSLTTS